MIRRKKQTTLQETIYTLRADKKTRKNRVKSKVIVMALLLLIVCWFHAYFIYIEGVIFLGSLIQYVWSKKRTGKENRKQKTHNEVRNLPLAVLAIYFALIGTIFTAYGYLRYILHIQIQRFMILDWLENSMAIFLLFEIVAIQLKRKRG